MIISDEERFWSKVNTKPNEHGCLLWRKSLRNGYGQFWLKGKTYSSHRVSFFFDRGYWLEEGAVISHICEDYYEPGDTTFKLCVNIEHLKESTIRENNLMSASNERRLFSGEYHTQNKLNNIDIIRIKRMIKEGIKQKEIAKLFGVSQPNISMIKNGKSWVN